MHFLFVSGGSGGHLSPLVAVYRSLMEMQPDADVRFICSDRAEDAAYLQKEGITPALILPRPKKNILLPWIFFSDVRRASRFIKEWKPDVVFTKGAAVSVPVCYAAHRKKIPIVLHESDAVMGNANRIIARWAKKICLGFPTHYRTTALPHSVVTGNPLRPNINSGSREEGLRLTGLDGKKPILLIMGGSQGAQAINEAIIKHIDALLQSVDIIHLTGKGKTGAAKRPGYYSQEFALEELPHLYAAASLALSRAGAGSIGELAANAKPTILVPIRGLAHDHQMRNATVAQENGGCIILLQTELDEKLIDVIRELSRDTPRLTEISKTIRTLDKPQASRQIAGIIVECVARNPSRH